MTPPLPDPDLLERYSRIDPEMARSLLAEALQARQQASEAARRERRWRVRQAEIMQTGLALATAGYVASVTHLAGSGRPWIGAAAFGCGLLVWYAVRRRWA